MKEMNNGPWELVRTIKLTNRNNKSMKLVLYPKKVSIIDDEDYQVGARRMKSRITDCDYSDSDIPILELFERLNKFCALSGNPRDVINMVVDAYKKNKDELKIAVGIFPSIEDKVEANYIRDWLL